MITRFLLILFWFLALLISAHVIVVASACLLLWIMGLHHPLMVGLIIGGNTLRAHEFGILTWSFIFAVLGVMFLREN